MAQGMCSIEGCERDAICRSWCHMHYQRHRRGIPMDLPVGRKRQPSRGGPCFMDGCDIVSIATGLCSRHYYASRTKADRAKNPDRWLGYHLSRYGITVDDFKAMLTAQGGTCAICGDAPERRLHVDHDHRTGQVRGLLCTGCNKGIGCFRDDPDRLRGAIRYLAER